MLTKNNTVKMYVEPMITGKSITLMASKYNLPIPGQSNTTSVIIAPPNEPDKPSASMVTIGGAAFSMRDCKLFFSTNPNGFFCRYEIFLHNSDHKISNQICPCSKSN